MKYKITKHKRVMPDGTTVYRIKALKTFVAGNGTKVIKGHLGGWVESGANLSQEGTCWLFDDATNSGNSRRTEHACGMDNAWSYGNSRQNGNSRQFGSSRQYGYSWQSGYSWQYGNSKQSGNSQQFGYSQQYEYSEQYGNSWQHGHSQQTGNSEQFGDSWQTGNSLQYGNSQQAGNSRQNGNSRHVTGIDKGHDILCLGPGGDSCRYVTVQPDNTVVAGCFCGTIEEFCKAVQDKYGADYGTYAKVVRILQTLEPAGP